MVDGVRGRFAGIFFRNIPRRALLGIALCIIVIASIALLWPLLGSLVTWQSHSKAVFEGEAIQVPIGWVIENSNDLLRLEKPGPTLFSGPGSEITIDPFAERHQHNLPLQRRLWLEGIVGNGELRDPRTGSPVSGFSDIRCAQSNIDADKIATARISCLSFDSLLQYDFWGSGRDFPAFQSVCRQAVVIARRHPGTVRPK
jgi:hypothetical protein